MTTPATSAEREAFETAMAMARALVIDGTPVAAVAAYWGLPEHKLVSGLFQSFQNILFEAAKVTNGWVDVEAMADGLRSNDD